MKCWWCNGTGSVGFLNICGECDGEGWVKDDDYNHNHQDSDDSIYDHLADHYDSKDYEANKTDDIPY
jgi:DnaJ-class molecular chaperone